MELVIRQPARAGLDRMNDKAAMALTARLRAIAADPRGRHPNVKRMVGAKQMYRLRQGDWRAVYRLDFEADRMVVQVIDVRGSVYR